MNFNRKTSNPTDDICRDTERYHYDEDKQEINEILAEYFQAVTVTSSCFRRVFVVVLS
jgi:hypothetical protein